jgi:HNH endonuclease
MKICWDNLEKLKYSKITGKWKKGTNTYIYVDSCEQCGEPYLSLNNKAIFCSLECRSKKLMNDLTGKTFERLTVIRKTGKNKYGQLLWLCKCECGNEKEIIGYLLTSNNVKSCGCYIREKIKNNLKGMKFGRLRVLNETEKRKKDGSIVWLCKCDCGNEVEISRGNLINGTKSCGCLQKEMMRNRKGENSPVWKGGVTEKNIPLYDTYAPQLRFIEKVRRNKEDKNILEVKCKKCRKWFVPTLNEITKRICSILGKRQGDSNLYCSDECKQSCSIYHKQNYQENHPNKPVRLNNKKWSKEVLNKFNHTCEICGSKENLRAHHIQPVKTNPELEEDVNNGACLCHDCHIKYGHKDECSLSNLRKLI